MPCLQWPPRGHLALQKGRWHWHCCLLGKTYLAMYDPHHTNSALDNFKLPRNLLLDTATQDMGPHFARRLLSMREYLHGHHPMAR